MKNESEEKKMGDCRRTKDKYPPPKKMKDA